MADEKILNTDDSSKEKLLLVYASRSEDLDNIRQLLSEVDINATDENGNTALHIAAKYSQFEIVKFLLERGAILEATNKGGVTPLHMAAFNPNSHEIFNHLLKKGANLYAVDNDGNTALHLAAASGNTSVIERIQKENPVFHKAKDNLGNTPLHMAARFGNSNAIETLLNCGASADAQNVDNEKPLDIAIKWGNEQADQILLPITEITNDKKPPPNKPITLKSRQPQPYRPLFPNENMMLANIQKQYKEGKYNPTLLHGAITWASDVLVLYRWINLGIRSLEGTTTNSEEAKVLYSQCAQFLESSKNFSYFYPEKSLLLSVTQRIDMSRSQLSNIASIAKAVADFYLSVKSKSSPPLGFAEMAAAAKKITTTEDKSKEKLGNVDVTVFNNADEVYRFLPAVFATLKYALTLNPDIWSDLKIEFVNLSPSVTPSHSLLFLSCIPELEPLIEPILRSWAEPELIEKLLDSGEFSINAQDEYGNTPLHVAAYWGYNNIVELLLKRGATTDIKNNENKTPYEVAEARGYKDICRLIQQVPLLRSLPENEFGLPPQAPPVPPARITSAQLAELKEELLERRTNSQSFVDFVHAFPGRAIAIAVFGFPLLFIPTIAVLVAAINGKSSQKPINDFVNEFGVAAVNNDVNTMKNLELDRAKGRLPETRMGYYALEKIRNHTPVVNNTPPSCAEQLAQAAKAKILHALNDAPTDFILKKEALGEQSVMEGHVGTQLATEEKDGGPYVVFTASYTIFPAWQLATDYDLKIRQLSTTFENFITAAFNVKAKRLKENREETIGMANITSNSIRCQIKVRDIIESNSQPQALEGFYEAYRVKTKLVEALKAWRKQLPDEDKKLATNIANIETRLNVQLDPLDPSGKYCLSLENAIENIGKAAWFDNDDFEADKKAQDSFVELLRKYLDDSPWKGSYHLESVSLYNSNKVPDDMDIEFTISQEQFANILSPKQGEEKTEATFGPMFPPKQEDDKGKGKEEKEHNDYQPPNLF